MPFEINPETGKRTFGFVNFLALVVTVVSFLFLFWAAFVLSKAQAQDNTMLIQITTGVLNLLMLIMAYFFGSSSSSARQSSQITEMQKTATTLALATATGSTSPAATEVKIDKAVKISELKAELEKLQPDSDEAKKILAQLEELEKKTP